MGRVRVGVGYIGGVVQEYVGMNILNPMYKTMVHDVYFRFM